MGYIRHITKVTSSKVAQATIKGFEKRVLPTFIKMSANIIVAICVKYTSFKKELKKQRKLIDLLKLKNENDLKTSNIYILKRIRDLEERIERDSETIKLLSETIERNKKDLEFEVKSSNHEKQS